MTDTSWQEHRMGEGPFAANTALPHSLSFCPSFKAQFNAISRIPRNLVSLMEFISSKFTFITCSY